MSTDYLFKLSILFFAIFFLSACCKIDTPKSLDADQYIGCYSSQHIEIYIENNNYIIINRKKFPFNIEKHKIGIVLKSNFQIISVDGKYEAFQSNEMIYRIIYRNNKNTIFIIDKNMKKHFIERIDCTDIM